MRKNLKIHRPIARIILLVAAIERLGWAFTKTYLNTKVLCRETNSSASGPLSEFRPRLFLAHRHPVPRVMTYHLKFPPSSAPLAPP